MTKISNSTVRKENDKNISREDRNFLGVLLENNNGEKSEISTEYTINNEHKKSTGKLSNTQTCRKPDVELNSDQSITNE